MSTSDNIQLLMDTKQNGLDGHELIALALFDLADVIHRSFRTQYVESSNALELIAQMLGADAGGGADGRSITGAIAYIADELTNINESLGNPSGQ